ncbi:MAG: HAD family phosphatase [Clostridia bacterium]|nr:HAD family phosphatase [Clostridia bacterium]
MHYDINGIKKLDKRLVALDLDGTVTQHKSPPDDAALEALTRLSEKHKLLIVGAGFCERIRRQLGFPADIIGSYGMQFMSFDGGTPRIVFDEKAPVNKPLMLEKAAYLREKYGYTGFAGDSLQFYDGGCVIFALLGTDAKLEDKLAFDPDRKKRRAFYDDVRQTFSDYNVFIGGTSSFDLVPKPYDKLSALERFCREYGYTRDETVFMGDDFGRGGNDEPVYVSDFDFIEVTDYRDFPALAKALYL